MCERKGEVADIAKWEKRGDEMKHRKWFHTWVVRPETGG